VNKCHDSPLISTGYTRVKSRKASVAATIRPSGQDELWERAIAGGRSEVGEAKKGGEARPEARELVSVYVAHMLNSDVDVDSWMSAYVMNVGA
jgi:hypothetical protein